MELRRQRLFNIVKWITGILLIVLFFFISRTLINQNLTLGLFLLIGLGLGYVESRSKIGIASGYIDFFIQGSRTRLYGLLLLFGAGALGAVGIHFQAAESGAVPSYLASGGQAVIPGTSAVSPVNFGLILGSFLFGVGLAINKGCGLGTLRNIGQGKMRYVWTFLFLLIGTIPGQLAKYHLDQSAIHDYSIQMYLPNQLGYGGTVIFTIVVLFILAILARRYEINRREQGTYKETEAMNLEEPDDDGHEKPISVFSREFFSHLFKNQWPRLVSVGLITIFMMYGLSLTGQKLAVTRPLLNPAVALFQSLGVSFNSPAFSEPLNIVENGLLNDANTLQNSGIFVGAAMYALTAAKFSFSWKMKWKESGWYMLSGFLMGFGAVLASGCIVGALYSGIVNFSLSGWVVFASMSLGIWVSVKLFNGRIGTIPKNKELN